MPALNEEANIEVAIRKNIHTFDTKKVDYEILIIDDGSKDKSRAIILGLAQKNPKIRYFFHEKTAGPGEAFRTGIKHSNKDYVVFVPFDNPLEIEDLEAYLPLMGLCDIIVGTRVKRVGYTTTALVASYIYNRILLPLFFNIGLADVNWIQVYRRQLFESNTLTFSRTKIFFLAEILVQAKRHSLIIAEVPATMRKRIHGSPTCSKFSTMWVTFWDLIKFFIKIKREELRAKKKA
jgi:dolichol-phosphate mannosyltransferase